MINEMKEQEDILIRPIETRDKEQLEALYDRVWPETAGKKGGKTSWAVDTSEYKGMLAEKNGLVIGSRMAFRSNVYCGCDKLTCVQFGDSCVDKDFRRYGLFTRMNRAFLETYFKDGRELIYNVSVEASKKAYQKVGWVYINALSTIFYLPKPISTLWKIKGNIKKLAGEPYIEDSSIPDLSIIQDRMLKPREEIMQAGRLIHSMYDLETLKWRVGTDSGIRLFCDKELGACFYKIGKKDGLKFLILGEFFPVENSGYVINKLLKGLIEDIKPDVVKAAITYKHPYYAFVKKFGFFNNPLNHYLNMGVRVNSEIMRLACLNPDNWAISNIDLDTF